MQKRGQVTIFIVAGIILLVGIILIFAFRSSLTQEEGVTEVQKSEQGTSLSLPVKNFVQSCLEQTGEDAILFVGNHGGYYVLPELADERFSLPYYFYEETNNVIPKSKLEQQISAYVNDLLFFCIRNFVTFREQGLEIEQGNVLTTTTIFDDKATLEVLYPITITQDDISTSLNNFVVEIPTRLGTIHGITEEFLVFQEEEPSSICISCLLNLALDNDLRAEMYFVREGEFMFNIIDEEVPVENKDYWYKFMNSYQFDTEDIEE